MAVRIQILPRNLPVSIQEHGSVSKNEDLILVNSFPFIRNVKTDLSWGKYKMVTDVYRVNVSLSSGQFK